MTSKHTWEIHRDQKDTGKIGVRIYCLKHAHVMVVPIKLLDKYVKATNVKA